MIISKKEYENLLSRINHLEEDKANSDKMIFDIECRLRQYIDDYFEHKCKTVVIKRDKDMMITEIRKQMVDKIFSD